MRHILGLRKRDIPTVTELLDEYIATRTNLRKSTIVHHRYIRNKIAKNVLAELPADQIRMSDAKKFFAEMQESGVSSSELRSMYSLLKLAFQYAADDGVITDNPFGFNLSSVVKIKRKPKFSLTKNQRDSFLEFVKNDEYFRKYYDVFYILFFTGMRISEFCGLTAADVDFVGGKVSVKRQLKKLQGEYLIEAPKTDAGIRDIPIYGELEECFKRIVEKSSTGDYLTADSSGNPTTASHWEHHLKAAVTKYNKVAEINGFELIPNVTPHTCRHTFCSLMAQSGVSPKTLQYLMGHSNISVTMDVYTHVDFDAVKREVERTALTKTDNLL